MALLRECLRSVRALRGDHAPPPLLPARAPQRLGFAQRPVAIGRKRLPGTPEPMHTWKMADGMQLAGDSWGDPAAPLVLLLHGLGQTRHAWSGTGRMLAEAGYHAVACDARGHGDSAWAADCDYSRDAMLRDLCGLVEVLGAGRPALVGAGIGGAASLLGAGEGHVRASALVLVDFAPRREEDGVERIRSFMRGNAAGFDGLEEVGEAIAGYHAQQLVPRQLEELARNVRLGPDGRYHWHWDPLLMARSQETLQRRENAARRLGVPTLLLRGGDSDVVSEQGARDFRALCPHAACASVPGAEHMVTGDRNDAFGRVALDFLQRTYPRSRMN